ncbi:MAG TPA: hypothetical protein VF980_00125 [Thermoanaerobaculia bacterium]
MTRRAAALVAFLAGVAGFLLAYSSSRSGAILLAGGSRRVEALEKRYADLHVDKLHLQQDVTGSVPDRAVRQVVMISAIPEPAAGHELSVSGPAIKSLYTEEQRRIYGWKATVENHSQNAIRRCAWPRLVDGTGATVAPGVLLPINVPPMSSRLYRGTITVEEGSLGQPTPWRFSPRSIALVFDANEADAIIKKDKQRAERGVLLRYDSPLDWEHREPFFTCRKFND